MNGILETLLAGLPPDYQSILIQFVGVTVIVMLLTERLTIDVGVEGGKGFKGQKNINAVIWSLPPSLLFWRFGLVRLPEVVANDPMVLRMAYVWFLAMVSALAAIGTVKGLKAIIGSNK